jgi:hypothetical protein
MSPMIGKRGLESERTAWRDIQKRCYNPHHKDFCNYGARGIKCLFSSFEEFLADVGPKPAQGYSINRIDNSLHYQPGNLRWDDRIAQNRNRRNNHVLTFNGESLCLAEWSERLGIHHNTLQTRIACGWSVERALSTQ